MRIAMVNAIFTAGGAARVATRMANHWAEQGHEVAMFSFESGEEPPLYPLHRAVTMTYLAINKFSPNLLASLVNNMKRFARIRRAIRRSAPDAVISFIDTANVRVLLAMLGSGIPVIVSERIDPAYEDIGPLWTRLRRLTYPLAAGVVVQTRSAAGYFSFLPPDKLRVIPNPVLPATTGNGAPRLDRPALVAVGRLYPQKAYDLMLRAFAHCSTAHPDWTLHIAGDGPLWEDLHQLADHLGVAHKVRFLGQVQDIGGMHAQADAYVLSSAYEGFPNALCEAMAAGLACVATDCPSGPAEIIRHEEDGLLVPNHDEQALSRALDRVMADSALRGRLGKKAALVIETFSVERVMAMWEECLGEARGGKG